MKQCPITFNRLPQIIFVLIGLFCFSPWISAPLALLLGCCLAQLGNLPFEKYSHTIIKTLLQVSIIGLGFGMNIKEALKAGKEGLLLTLGSIFLTLGLGILLGRKLKINFNITLLIAAGTAICGGSAIAALAPLLSAKKTELSVSLGTIFLLNAIALFLFPWLGHFFHLSQNQFGLWAAIAIHDTSSVVAAAGKYGTTAMHIATTVKLERALWIIPVSFLALFFCRGKEKVQVDLLEGESAVKPAGVKIPYFIFLFILAMIANTFLHGIQPIGKLIVPAAEKLLTLTLFFIGAGLSRKSLKVVGIKPLCLGILLWCFISCLSLWVMLHWEH